MLKNDEMKLSGTEIHDIFCLWGGYNEKEEAGGIFIVYQRQIKYSSTFRPYRFEKTLDINGKMKGGRCFRGLGSFSYDHPLLRREFRF
jgi:hypothetical protein